MRKTLFTALLFFCAQSIYAQAQETDKSANANNKVNKISNIRALKTENAMLANPAKDKISEYSITGTGANTFSVSNISNGTNSATQPEQKIVLELLTINKNDKIELIFHSNPDGMITVGEWEGVTNVYYPLSMYESIKQKLDQAISTKKKAILKVKMLADGKRDAQLIF